ncbi:MAG: SsrA-binding protein [Candidatus Woesebacteria bacterium GW2011_GWA1_37_8]|uniref:SsrA-binding protein n=2 Tax=Candidatus Woeseibacteriota TaxID=1752722 RepID=A0A0G0NKF4_9BACT|nr:MAG: SsrA-binding protein [Microgenomates group bacterium GW2011_GWC1_37_12b]KKQ43816.1 MAG: SsrA-binding protein [Candidatus Woesebacteria bacterium GW2011_GWA1_37_8]KKQ86384.1 MAG: SsrA-binding protein [Candidatus Woesebacteria bacterium GW2011_GWB1_38_8b]
MAILNKKAGFEYFLYERFEAGISLIGGEVRSVRKNNVDLSNSYAKFVDNELFLVNANIPIEGKKDYVPTRSRKLLLHKSELISITSKLKAKKLTLVPVKMYNKGRLIKVELALAKSKRSFEKRDSIKKKDIERDLAEQFADKYN